MSQQNQQTNSSNTDNKKKTKKKLSRASSTFLIVLSLLFISAILALYILESANDFLGFSQESKQVTIEVPEGMSLSKVTKSLKKEGKILTKQ